MRGDLEQNPTFPAGLEHEAQVTVLEIAQAAVYEPRATGASARPEVTHVDEDRTDSAHRSVAGDPSPRDTAADHQQLDRLGGQCLQGCRARLMRKRSVH
jgi:hypothetical protein